MGAPTNAPIKAARGWRTKPPFKMTLAFWKVMIRFWHAFEFVGWQATAAAYAWCSDDEPIPMLERPWATQIQETTTADQFLAGVAHVLVASAQRADALVLAAFEAARSDERLAPLAAHLKAQRITTAAWIVDGIATRSPLRTSRAQ